MAALSSGDNIAFPLFVGFGICCFGLLAAFVVVCIDRWAEKKDKIQATLSDSDKFKCSDLKKLTPLPFIILTIACVTMYKVLFTYIGNGAAMLEDRFGFTKT